MVFSRAREVSWLGWLALGNEDYVRLPNAGEPAIGLPTPMAYEPSPAGWQAAEPEQAREIDRGGVGRGDTRRGSRADGRNAGSALAPDDLEGHGSITLSPRPATTGWRG